MLNADASKPLFSIVTVTLNAGDNLDLTLRSVRDQTFKSYEHIIKDGGSKDGSVSKIAPDERTSIKVSPDKGIFDAMNQALQFCRGEYVIFMNAGDTFKSPDVLERVAGVCEGRALPDLIYTDYSLTGLNTHIKSPPRVTTFLLYRTTICHQACFIRRHWYDRLGGFDLPVGLSADWDFLVMLMRTPGATAHYLPIVGCNFIGGGYCQTPKNFPLYEESARKIRRKNFSAAERAWFAGIYALTLPWLRIAIVRNPRMRLLREAYAHVVNGFYHLFSRGAGR